MIVKSQPTKRKLEDSYYDEFIGCHCISYTIWPRNVSTYNGKLVHEGFHDDVIINKRGEIDIIIYSTNG